MRLGIAVCTFNRRETVKETIRRVRAHTRSEHELVVVDDGSSDGHFEHGSAKIIPPMESASRPGP